MIKINVILECKKMKILTKFQIEVSNIFVIISY